jgi:DNA-binding MarR family transcriptional regulator
MKAIGRAFLTWTRYRKKEILPYGITLKQFEVLRQLRKRESLYPAEIADMLFCDRPTASVVIKNMEKQGWVKRQLDRNDSRHINVTLEPAGKAKLNEITWEQPKFKGKRFEPFSCFTRQEKEQFTKLLAKLNQHLEQLKKNANA